MTTTNGTEAKRLADIKARVEGIPDWFPLGGDGNRIMRIPPNPSRAQREFIACAPEDIRWLISQVEALVPQPESLSQTQTPDESPARRSRSSK